jgi:hypothetical protein
MKITADAWIAIATFLLFTATALGALFVLWELHNSRREAEKGHREAEEERRRVRKQATITFYTQTLERLSAWQASHPPDWDKAAIDAMLEKLADDTSTHGYELNNEIHSYLAFWELTATALNHEVFDEELFKDLLKRHFLALRENYRPFIDKARNEKAPSGGQLYVQIERLARKLEEQEPRQGRDGEAS